MARLETDKDSAWVSVFDGEGVCLGHLHVSEIIEMMEWRDGKGIRKKRIGGEIDEDDIDINAGMPFYLPM